MTEPTPEQTEAATKIIRMTKQSMVLRHERTRNTIAEYIAARDARRDAEIIRPWREALKGAEWVNASGHGDFCPSCLEDKSDGHDKDCATAALLSSPRHPSPAPNKGERR